MKYNPSKHLAKNGIEVTVKEATVLDAKELLFVKLEYIDQSDSIPLTAKQYEYNTVEKESQLIEKLITPKDSTILLATINGKIVGNIDVIGTERIYVNHTAMIAIGISENFRGIGVGEILLKEAILWCKDHTNLEVLWLEVFEDNHAGIKLYKKCGFIENGRIPNFVKRESVQVARISMDLPL